MSGGLTYDGGMSDPRDTTPLSAGRRQARAEQHQHAMIELQQLAKQIDDLELQLSVARSTLDGRLYYLHEDGVAIAELARNARRSRETVYQAIDRYRAENHTPRGVSVNELPDAPGDGLNDMQLDGFACIICGRADDRPLQPAGFGPRGQVFRHEDCARDELRDTERDGD
jgi:hypothetical protein